MADFLEARHDFDVYAGEIWLFYLASIKAAIMNFFSCTVSKQKRIVGPLNMLINPDTYFI